jgi:hypothetical protein
VVGATVVVGVVVGAVIVDVVIVVGAVGVVVVVAVVVVLVEVVSRLATALVADWPCSQRCEDQTQVEQKERTATNRSGSLGN